MSECSFFLRLNWYPFYVHFVYPSIYQGTLGLLPPLGYNVAMDMVYKYMFTCSDFCSDAPLSWGGCGALTHLCILTPWASAHHWCFVVEQHGFSRAERGLAFGQERLSCLGVLTWIKIELIFKFHFIKNYKERKIKIILETFFLCIQQTGQTLSICCLGCFLTRLHLTLWPLPFSITGSMLTEYVGT